VLAGQAHADVGASVGAGVSTGGALGAFVGALVGALVGAQEPGQEQTSAVQTSKGEPQGQLFPVQVLVWKEQFPVAGLQQPVSPKTPLQT